MLLQADSLTRLYGNFVAVDGLSFHIDRGEIVGFLGPNGAGKTTTLRMLTCFLPPTSGTARIAGFDIHTHSMKVRQHVGYMPENNPLYGEMRCEEYLKFRSQLKGIPRSQRRRQTDYCVELCDLGEVRNRPISALSKGYRQRVGLADSLLANPDVLLLDEPTIGLDPNQIRRTRQTIRDLGEEHTVLLSTHILQEAEATCDRVIIIDRGQIVADESVGDLSGKASAPMVKAQIKAEPSQLKEKILALDCVAELRMIEEEEWQTCLIIPGGNEDVRPTISGLAAREGWPLRELTIPRTTREEVFQHLTQRTDMNR